MYGTIWLLSVHLVSDVDQVVSLSFYTSKQLSIELEQREQVIP